MISKVIEWIFEISPNETIRVGILFGIFGGIGFLIGKIQKIIFK